MSQIRILGVDPGSIRTGYGVIDSIGGRLVHVAHGTWVLSGSGMPERLLSLFEGLDQLIRVHRPQVMVVEKAFFAKNAQSALKLGQARGVVLLAGARNGLDQVEYSPNEVKQSLSGYGHADKDQVARMVELLLGKQVFPDGFPTSDASDALALAICHAHMTPRVQGMRRIDVTRNP